MGLFSRSKRAASTAVNTNLSPARSVYLVQDSTGAPAVSLEKVAAEGGVSLRKKTEKAGISLSKRGIAGLRGAVRLYVDHSGSMEFPEAMDYTNGNVQTIVERALGYGLQLDSDGNIPVLAFDSRLWPAVQVNASNYQGIVNHAIWHPRQMGGTVMANVMNDLLAQAQVTDEPIFAIIVTDGDPHDDRETTRLVKELAAYPVFLKFLAIRPVDYLDYLDNLEEREPGSRLIDNVDSKFLPNPGDMSDLAFADAMADEVDSWVNLALQAGVLVRA